VTDEPGAVPNPRRDCSKALVGYTPDGLGYLAWCPEHYVTPDGHVLPWYSPAAVTLEEAKLLRAAHSLTQETGGQTARIAQ
jgi:hypothetical protein